MSSDGDKLRAAAHRLQAIADKATPRLCPDWTYSAVRHIARNCDIDCSHGEAWTDADGVNHMGWDRYDDSPWITAMGAQVAAPLVLLLDHAAAVAEVNASSVFVRSTLALVDAIAWPADEDGAS